MTTPHPHHRAPAPSEGHTVPDTPPADPTLKALLRQTVATPPGATLARVEHNALSSWHAHQAALSLQQRGPNAALGQNLPWLQRHPQVVWLLVATAMALAVGLRPTTDPTLDDLQHPDVLSQLLMDEL